MKLEFFKYQGTGNDFVIIDNRQDIFPKNDTKLVAELCDRRFGIGADGLMLLENDEASDFKMVYYNSDGGQSTMCGNGGRCLVAFAHYLGVIGETCTFNAVDGLHEATVDGDIVKLKMIDVDEVHEMPNHIFLDTGSPHHVQLVKNLPQFDVQKEGKRLRYGLYGESGSNINFVEQEDGDVFQVRTYERGVEGETYSCGTGVTAVALAMHESGKTSSSEVHIKTLGGDLTISFEKSGEKYSNVYLKGPAIQVFKGEVEC
ncbi:diaminopimelate epimerase [Flagellimonas zhangzhouensis]|uniref:Diaminopimelate epimerase n=1 Tax=Flagellimonas zhangzhouensis TaxID=1073328 RepID=A0A1H2RYJ8_9FLAO|nr:diaminopimelate epimerase [Allomuricauda zhangzhouensis]SDQ68748.1 diaminopimelate epimerase [Allomuricauda zhangzhouensis]SDW24365.1 diaminopimelate epimerase [Allomuricauda zhangzhouensis]